jgi:hypothetical protein
MAVPYLNGSEPPKSCPPLKKKAVRGDGFKWLSLAVGFPHSAGGCGCGVTRFGASCRHAVVMRRRKSPPVWQRPWRLRRRPAAASRFVGRIIWTKYSSAKKTILVEVAQLPARLSIDQIKTSVDFWPKSSLHLRWQELRTKPFRKGNAETMEEQFLFRVGPGRAA